MNKIKHDSTQMTLLEYFKGKIENGYDIDVDLIIGDVDTVATISYDTEEYKFTKYCMEKYGCILNGKINIINEDYSSNYAYVYSTIEIIGDIPYELGYEFQLAMTGYISDNEYSKLFRDN